LAQVVKIRSDGLSVFAFRKVQSQFYVCGIFIDLVVCISALQRR